MADDQSELEKDLERKKKLAALGYVAPKPSDLKQRLKNDLKRNQSTEPRRDIPLLTTNKQRRANVDNLDPGQRLFAERAAAAGAAVHTTPPAEIDERTGRMNNLDGELRRQIARIDELFRRLGNIVPTSGSGGGCGGTPTSLSGSGVDADTETFAPTAGGLVTLAIETRDYWDSSGDVLYYFTRNVTFRVCSVSAETRHTTDTPTDCPP